MDASHHREVSGRRRFLAMIGMAGLASSLGIGRALAQSAAPPAAPMAPAPAPAAAATPAPAAAAAPEISEDARALAAIVERRYGKHLGGDDLKEITEELEFRLQNGKRLRGASLTNADEPDATFHA